MPNAQDYSGFCCANLRAFKMANLLAFLLVPESRVWDRYHDICKLLLKATVNNGTMRIMRINR